MTLHVICTKCNKAYVLHVRPTEDCEKKLISVMEMVEGGFVKTGIVEESVFYNTVRCDKCNKAVVII